MCDWLKLKFFKIGDIVMNIYEDEELEEKFEEITHLIGQLLIDMVLVNLRKISHEYQTYQEFAETRNPKRKRTQPF